MKHPFRIMTLIAIFAALLSCGDKSIDESKNLASNGSFENATSDLPDGWQKDVWEAKKRRVNFTVEKGSAYSGDKCIGIENIDSADSKLYQRISVMPDTYYKLSAWIKAEGVPEGQVGANISVMSSLAVSRGFTDTKGEWQYVEFFGVTGPEQTFIDAACRLGVYGQENLGKAWFDDFAIYGLASAPFGKQVQKLFDERKEEKKEEVPQSILDAKKQTNANFWIIVFSAVFIIIFIFMYLAFVKEDTLGLGKKKMRMLLVLILLLAIAFAGRVVMGYLIEGEEGDLACFKGWGGHLLTVEWPDYYDYFSAYLHERPHDSGMPEYWCDYPPVYIMVLGFLALINSVFNLSAQMYTALIKLPNIISDIIACILIYRIAKRKLSDHAAFGLSVLYAFNPAIIINSAVWGQADALYTMLALFIVEGIQRDKMWLSGIVLGIAILIKIQTAFVAFALLYALAERKSIKQWLATVLAGFGTFVVLILPFAIKLPPEWIIVQLVGTLTGYPFASVNAYNFFSLFGANWRPSSEPFLLGISSDWWGIAIGYALLVFSAFIFFYGKEKSRSYYSGLFAISVIFMFIPGMHERYLYAAVLFSAMAYIYEKDKRFLFLFLCYSITVFVNVYHILDVFIVSYITHSPIPAYPGNPLEHPFMLATSIANLLLFIYMMYVGIDVYIMKKLMGRKFHDIIGSLKLMGKKKPVIEPQPTETAESVSGDALSATSASVSSEVSADGSVTPLPVEPEPPKPGSKLRNLVLCLGIASAAIPPLSIIPWLLGRSELKKYPDDNRLRAGWALGLGVFVIIVTGIIFSMILFPGLKGAGYIK